MKKIAIGLAVLCSFLSLNSFAASTVTSQNETPAPYYNGGFSFGLAGYNVKPAQTNPAVSNFNNDYYLADQQKNISVKPEYK